MNGSTGWVIELDEVVPVDCSRIAPSSIKFAYYNMVSYLSPEHAGNEE
jgi:hypothetical protein